MIASFDIFDTCLVRLCGTPAGLFDVLSYKVFRGTVPESARQRFVAERREAEYLATARLGARTTLADIYDSFAFTHPLLPAKQKLMEMEMACEKAMLRPVATVIERIHVLRDKGVHIVFISDMYLSGTFLRDILILHGLFVLGKDSLYVSCEAGKFKYKGELFNFVREQEGLSGQAWVHFGDNRKSDRDGAKRVGIRARLIQHEYSPIQRQWLNEDVNVFNYPAICAGISRALRHSNPDNSHKDIVLDLIAPLLCSYVYRVMKNAAGKGIERLYFCARDAWAMYLIAAKMQPLFPSLEIRYLNISRDALCLGEDGPKIAYYEQEKLAAKSGKAAIVDLVTGGMTMLRLNALLSANGYKKVHGYFLYKWEHFDIPVDYDYTQFEISQAYLKGTRYDPFIFLVRTQLFENFFGLNSQQRTLGYNKDENGRWTPVFEARTKGGGQGQDGVLPDRSYWATVHQDLIGQFADAFLETGLYRFSEDVFRRLALNALVSFSLNPSREYLEPLLDYHCSSDSNPYVRKASLLQLLAKRGRDAEWRRGTFYYSLPSWVMKIVSAFSSLRR